MLASGGGGEFQAFHGINQNSKAPDMVGCKSRIIVIGGGVVGVSTFYELARRRLEPVLLEASRDLASVTSFANGGMLTPSMPEPWNSPGVGRHLLSSVFNPSSPMKIRLGMLPAMIPWGLRFLYNSTGKKHRRATMANFALADRSVRITQQTIEEFGIRCESATAGALKIFSSTVAMREALANAEMLQSMGLKFETLSAGDAIRIEPELAAIKDRICCGIYYREDAVGDAYKFTQALSHIGRQFGGGVRTDCKVINIEVANGAIAGVQTDDEFIAASDVIVAAGNASSSLVNRHGVRLAVKPAKGYSVTLNAEDWRFRPKIPVIDDGMHAAITPIGDRIRLAGTAEFAGNDLTLDMQRVENLYKIFSSVYPDLAKQVDRDLSSAWTGLRPMSADGMPFIGQAGPRGLWINTGHGHLGWTMAMGSAEMIGHLVMGEKPAIDAGPYKVGR